jgi:hypothetical protein
MNNALHGREAGRNVGQYCRTEYEDMEPGLDATAIAKGKLPDPIASTDQAPKWPSVTSQLHVLCIAENLTAANTASKTSCLGWRKQLSSGS